jgi:NAD(P)-dependent dehydrogenase (short-subunit alcohol dehydrogenase family)
MSGIAGNALVTGGSRGIGRSCALSLARAGADVALTYVANEEAAEATAAEIRALGRRAVTIRGDVGVAEDNVATVEKVISELGPLRYLVAYTAFGTAAGKRPRPRRDRRPRHLPPLRRGADGDRADAPRRRRLHPPWLKGIHGLHRAE